MKDYHINIFYSEEDHAYVADIPDLKGCSAFGETPEAALRELGVAKAAWLAVAQQKALEVPKPSYQPLLYQLSQAGDDAASMR